MKVLFFRLIRTTYSIDLKFTRKYLENGRVMCVHRFVGESCDHRAENYIELHR